MARLDIPCRSIQDGPSTRNKMYAQLRSPRQIFRTSSEEASVSASVRHPQSRTGSRTDPFAKTWIKALAMKIMLDIMMAHLRPSFCVTGSCNPAPKKLPPLQAEIVRHVDKPTTGTVPWNRETRFAEALSLADLLWVTRPKSCWKLGSAREPPKNPACSQDDCRRGGDR